MQMRKGAGLAVPLALVVGAMLTTSQPAAAAVRVGNDCFADKVVEGSTLVQLASDPANPLPLTVPEAGVLTRWTSKSELEGPVPERLKVLRATAVAGQFEVIGESAEQQVPDGINTFNTRIPVQAGDRLGVYGAPSSGGLTCPGKAGDHYGYFAGNLPTGSAGTFEQADGRVAVSALVEPDADHDGFGDETQDRCPQSASLHDAVCPRISLSSFALGGRVSAQLLVAADAIVPVTASGTVRLPGRAKKRTGTSTQLRLSPVTQTVAPGQIAQFTLPFPKPLLSALRKLPRGRSLQLSLEAGATDLAGAVTTTGGTVRLRGQARPHR
jgi:hypothetical protein